MMCVPSSALTTTDSVLLPTLSVCAAEALPLATVALPTLMVAPLLVAVGVNVTELTPLATVAV